MIYEFIFNSEKIDLVNKTSVNSESEIILVQKKQPETYSLGKGEEFVLKNEGEPFTFTWFNSETELCFVLFDGTSFKKRGWSSDEVRINESLFRQVKHVVFYRPTNSSSRGFFVTSKYPTRYHISW